MSSGKTPVKSPPKPKAGVVLYSTLQASHQGVTRKMGDDAALFSSSEKGEESDEDEIVEFSPEVVPNPPPSTTPASSVKATTAPSAGGSSAAGAAVQISSQRKLVVQPTPAAVGAATKASTTPDAGADAKVKAGNAGGRPMLTVNVFQTVVKGCTENPSMDIRVKVTELLKVEKVSLEHIVPLVTHATDFVFGVVASDEQSVRDLINKTIKKEDEKEILIKSAGVIEGILIRNDAYDWEFAKMKFEAEIEKKKKQLEDLNAVIKFIKKAEREVTGKIVTKVHKDVEEFLVQWSDELHASEKEARQKRLSGASAGGSAAKKPRNNGN